MKKKNGTGEYGEALSFNKIFLGKMEDGEFITMEEYLNNDGSPCGSLTLTRQKVESLCHYYVKSQQKLMVVDVQGSGHQLFHPEITSFVTLFIFSIKIILMAYYNNICLCEFQMVLFTV